MAESLEGKVAVITGVEPMGQSTLIPTDALPSSGIPDPGNTRARRS